ncbi:MAG: 2-oxoglutarate dehydrogenase, E2 component, dihydrolipoamide succinyltransferase [Geodermatophilaceae bacterium]|nr:2-oxoglutarate dehydrogenase, E2 component, dihydrolipoamide succinyltransferase [Geodermatophilaceae bacterium]
MPTSVTMPQLGESVTEGTVTRWLKQEGDEVQADEPLLEVSTDKVDTEIPAPASGVLTKIMVAEDETVQVGAELAVIGDSGGSADPSAANDSASSAEEAPAVQAPAAPEPDQQNSAESPSAESEPAEQGRSAAAESEEGGSAESEDGPSAASDAGSESASSDSGSGPGTSVTMPALGESVTEGTVTRWLKAVGDTVQADEPLLEVSTDKVDTEIPAPTSGVLRSIAVAEDETVQVGAELAVIGSDDGSGDADPSTPAAEQQSSGSAGTPAEPEAAEPEAVEPEAAEPEAAEPEAAEPEAAEPAPAPRADTQAASDAEPPSEAPAVAEPAPGSSQDQATGGGSISANGGAYVTPLVRKLATEHKVDLGSITGTGVGGRIRKQDVLEAASGAKQEASQSASPDPAKEAAAATSARAEPESAPAPQASKRGRTEKLTRLRALIANRMVESLQVSAQLTTVVEVDLTLVARLRDRVKHDFLAREGVKLSFLPFFALAAVEALKAYPTVNSSIDSAAGTVTYHDSENLGIAVDTERGLLVPVIHDAGDLNLGGIARKIADLAERTRNNKVTPDELGGGTFTLTNTGSRGALFDTPIINQPQVAILGTGTVVKRPVVVDDPNLGEIVTVRSMVYLALTYDHRIVDGADAARFLVSMKERLEGGDFESSLGLS